MPNKLYIKQIYMEGISKICDIPNKCPKLQNNYKNANNRTQDANKNETRCKQKRK